MLKASLGIPREVIGRDPRTPPMLRTLSRSIFASPLAHACALAALATSVHAQTPPPQPITTIAFGSCARERQPQPIWTEIIATKPDLFLFIGDNQYADFWEKDGRMVMAPVEHIDRINEAYAALAAQPGYQRILRTCPIMATWDDHDYGANDAGTEYPLKRASQTAFLDFYGFPENAPIRKQEGIYHARTFGPEGKRVQVIMLDTRYHRDPLEKAPDGQRTRRGPYVPTTDTSKTILGPAQWEWLEKQLKEPAQIRIIASSIQVIADEHGWETWGNFPHERERLYRLIESTNASGVIVLSGDRHLTEITLDRPNPTTGLPAYPIWDFTSSGMTQKPEVPRDPNAKRVGPVRKETTFGLVRIQWADEVASTQIEFLAVGDQGQMLTRQSVFLGDLSERR